MNKKLSPMLRRASIIAVATMMLSGGSAFALESDEGWTTVETPGSGTTSQSPASITPSMNMKFKDVSSDFWAYKHITKLALQGIVLGKGDNTFVPDQPVKQQDAVIMAIRFMGLEQEAKQSDGVIGFDVADYARNYIFYALKNKLLDRAEIMDALTADTSGTQWGEKPASREWVAKLVVRAIGMQNEAEQLAGTASIFADNNKISSWALGYVNEAVKLKIVTGFEDSTFRPSGSVTRAQIATFLSRSGRFLGELPANVTAGTVTGLTADSISVLDGLGATKTYLLSENTVFFNKEDQKNLITANDIQLYTSVYVIHNGGTAYYVEQTDAVQQMEKTEGSVVSLDLNSMQMVLKTSDGANQTFTLDDDVTVVDPKGNSVQITEIIPGTLVQLDRLSGNANARILNVVVKHIPFNKSGEATIKSIDKDNNSITLTMKDNVADETYVLSDSPAITDENSASIGTADLNAGDIIAFQVTDGKLASVQVKVARYVNVEGTFLSADLSNLFMIVKKPDGTKEVLDIMESTQVQISGLKSPTLKDLEAGDTVRVQLNGMTNKVEKVSVVNRDIEPYNKAVVQMFSDKLNWVLVDNSNGNQKPVVYEINSKSVLSQEGVVVPTEKYSSVFLNRKVNITVSGNKIVTMELANKYEATITKLEAATNTITVKTQEGDTLAIPMMYGSSIEIFGKTTVSFKDLNVGDQVTLILNPEQDRISKVLVKKPVLFKVTGVESSTGKISVKDEANVTTTYTIDDKVTLLRDNGTPALFGEISTLKPVILTFNGKTLQSVKLVDVTIGQVTAIDTANRKITLRDFNGVEQVMTIGLNVKIIENGTVSTNLATMMVNQRAEVSKDALGNSVVKISTGQKKQFWKYDAAENEISFKHKIDDKKYTFGFHPQAYIHSGTSSLSLSTLKDNDTLTVYIIDDKIIELEK